MPRRKLDPSLSDNLDAAWGNPETWTANGLHWMDVPEVRALVNLRVSGDAGISPMAWFAGHLAREGALPLGRALVLGCGSGRTERELRANGWARQVVAFDLSPKVLQVARQASAGIEGIHYVLADMDRLPVGEPPFEPGSFDAVLGVQSVHHCSQLESLYGAVARLLKPQGWLFLDEYVGPDRFQFSAAHVRQVRAMADLLPDHLLSNRLGQVRRGFRAPTVAEVLAVDPSEAACASRILPLLTQHFDLVAQRPYGGAILHMLLAEVAQNFQRAQARPWLQALLDAEAELDQLGLQEQHFSCVIARARGSSVLVR